MERGKDQEDPGLKYQDIQEQPPPVRDSQGHCLVCPSWTHLREDLDLTGIIFSEDIGTYIKRVIKTRIAKSDTEKKERKKDREQENKSREEGQKRKRGE